MRNLFNSTDLQITIDRVNQLTNDSKPTWGKMNVAQMLAHLNVGYEMAHEDIHPKANFFMRFMLKTFVKPTVCGPKPYPKNGKTAPQFVMTGKTKAFEAEKKRLIDYMQKTQNLGPSHFEGKESPSFGALTADEWNVLFAKHLDHHLTQFGV
ncbi:MAG: DUF1569 domain-containing protein [Saprospiraceae bacterium]